MSAAANAASFLYMHGLLPTKQARTPTIEYRKRRFSPPNARPHAQAETQ